MTNPGILMCRKIIRINSAQRETRSTTFSGPNLQCPSFLQKNDKILTISVLSSLLDLLTRSLDRFQKSKMFDLLISRSLSKRLQTAQKETERLKTV